MKILHVNKFLYRAGGAEGYMFDVAELQRAAGRHEVTFFGMQDERNESLPYAESFAPHATLDPMPAGIGVRLKTARRMYWNRPAARGIASVLDEFRPDVVHLHNVYHQLSPSILRPIADRNVPTVMTLHDYKLVCPTYLMLDKGQLCDACVGGHFSQAVRRRCKDGSLTQSLLLASELALHHRLGAYGPIRIFVCPSRFMLETMRRGGVYPDRLRHLPHFARVGPRPSESTAREPVVLYAGRLSEEKGPDVLVRAAGLLPPGLHVEIAGDGPRRAELEQLAADVAPGRVHFHGRLPKDALDARLAACRLVVVPSRCHENQPMSILEAYGFATPVVASRLGGIPELVVEGRTGLLVDPDDPVSLAAAVATIAEDSQRAAEMGRAGRALVEEGFTPEVHLTGLERLYREAGAPVAPATATGTTSAAGAA
jgi:glycosyltransferase involved in cell wall biosynthesis